MRRRPLALSMPVVAALTAALLAGPGAGAAGAETCNGTLSGNRDLDSLVVPDRGRCTIGPNAEVSVGGRVDVGANARLWVQRDEADRGALRVRGAMSLDQGSSFLDGGRLTLLGALTGRPDKVAVLDDAYIGGRVSLTSVAQSVEFEDVAIDGDVEIGSGRGGTLLTKIHVDGDLSVHDKRFGAIAVRDSSMERLTVVDNTVTGIRIVDNIVGKGFTCGRNQTTDSEVFRNVVAGVSRLAESC
jgi:hypothetical protein